MWNRTGPEEQVWFQKRLAVSQIAEVFALLVSVTVEQWSLIAGGFPENLIDQDNSVLNTSLMIDEWGCWDMNM